MIELRPVLLINGVLLATLGSAMMLPAVVDLIYDNDDWLVFVAAAGLTLFAGGAMAFANIGAPSPLNTRQAFLLTTLIWILIPAFSAIPFVWSRADVSYTDAYFEAMSGVTTTGATVFDDLESRAPGILFWRALLQWFGGIGIIVMAIAVMPMLKVGGMQLFRLESSDNSGKILPRARQIANTIATLYGVLTAACFLAYAVAGMNGFEALTHAMTTIATGGFSTRDKSIGGFESLPIEMVSVTFMLLSSLPFLVLWQARFGRISAISKDVQVRVFFLFMGCFVFLAWLAQTGGADGVRGLGELRNALFNAVSIMTGTGYATSAYDNWSAFASMLFLLMMFVGGCAGSTSCGIKVFRFYVLFVTLRNRVQGFMQPHRILVARFNGKPMGPEVSRAVMNFFFLFLLIFGLFSLALGMQGLDPLTALSAAASALANVGPGLGPIVGPDGNYGDLPESAKWTLSFAMLMGRLELLTVLVLFAPAFWRS